MPDKDTIEQAPELFDQAGPEPKAAEIHPALAPAIQQVQQLPANVTAMTSQDMIAYALTNDKLDALDKLIAMKNSEEDRANKRDFTLHFSEMQRDFPPVFRDGAVKGKDGSHKYSYISLDAILKVYSPIIAKHGFGFRWTEEEVKEGKEKRVWCIVFGYGHEERTYLDIPVMGATDFTNAIQQRGSATSYGKRYSFMNLFGVIVADEDNDAATFEDGVKLGMEFQLIREATTQKDRKDAYMRAIARKDLTDHEKVLLASEAKKKAQELREKGVTE